MLFYPDGSWHETAGYGGRVIGAMPQVKSSQASGMPAAIGAYLQPARVSTVLPVPASELTDRVLPIEDIWCGSGARLSEQLAPLSERARLDLLESTLLRRIAAPRRSGSAVDVRALASLVVRHSGRVPVDALADAAGVSRQHLTRVFRERVGVSPKLFCRLARFHSTLGFARPGAAVDWARVAFQMGYADQSHMIAEFRQFSSMTPHMLTTARWFHPFIERAQRRSHHSVPVACRSASTSS